MAVPEASTYYSAAKALLAACSLRVEMVHPDSINDFHIETAPVIVAEMKQLS
jgi:hypothetical protein